MRTISWISLLVSFMVNAVLFGVGLVTVLMIPALQDQLPWAIVVVVVFSFALSPFISRRIAPHLRLRHHREDR